MTTTTRFASIVLTLLFLVSLTGLGASSALAQESIIHRFVGQPTDGYFPVGGLINDENGNLYGATYSGGTFDQGTVFELIRPAASKTGWHEIVLYNFTRIADGGNPLGGLVFDGKGNLFGTTYNGGAGSFPGGVVYELSPPPAGKREWTQTTLFDFSISNAAVGLNPQGALTIDAAGNLFGVAAAGGAGMADLCGDTGCGSVFELQPPAVSGGA